MIGIEASMNPGRALRRMVLLAAVACAAVLAVPTVAAAEFGIVEFDTGSSSTQAGAHADAETNFRFTVNEEAPQGPGKADGHVRLIEVDLPHGLLGDPSATPTCSHDDFSASACPPQTQVGTVDLWLNGPFPPIPGNRVYNLTPGANEPALLGVILSGFLKSFIRVSVEADGRVRATVDDLPFGAAVMESRMTLWGVPADHNGGGWPRRAFMSMPTNCTDAPTATLRAVPYEDPGVRTATFTEPIPAGCEAVPFAPSIEAKPTNSRAGEPTGLDFTLNMPYDDHPDRLVTAHLKDATITLPEGMAMNPSAANGLQGCSDAGFSIETTSAPQCPAASRLGTVEIESPAARETLKGDVFLATQKAGDPYRLLVTATAVGVRIKLEGSIQPDPVSGRLTTVFRNNPQLPFTKLSLALKGGPRAPLVTPRSCGVHSTSFRFTSWAGHDVTGSAPMAIDQGCAPRPFAVGFQAGSTNPVAGDSAGFSMILDRDGLSQEIRGIDVTLPPGLLANIGSVPRCPEPLAAAGTCGVDSKVGSVNVAAGAGSSPFWAPEPGRAPTAVYLAGPYRGFPFSLSVVVPAQAGPFDLGRVVVRVGLKPDPRDTSVSAPLLESRVFAVDGTLEGVLDRGIPRILGGIPLNLRTINLTIDRPGFMRNPTNCEPKRVGAQLSSQEGAVASVGSRFQVGDCGNLGFKPHIALRLEGGTKRDKNPALTATMRAREGDANIGRVAVALPRSEFLDQDHINTVCTRVQFAARSCPEGSIYGFAEATTPLLDQPLKGPVYLRSSANPLPDLVAALDGQVEIELVGRIDSVRGGIRTTFDFVPDAPVTKFVLKMKGGKKGLLVNSTNICRGAHRAVVKMKGQNGRKHSFKPALKHAKCKKGKR